MNKQRVKLGRVVVVGRGKVGRALASALRAQLKGEVRLTRGRGRGALKADTVILAVPDGSLAHMALALAEPKALVRDKLRRAPIVLHLSGLRDATVLDPLRQIGAAVGAMHPLVSFAARKSPPALEGASMVITGDPLSIAAARRLTRLLGMKAIVRARSPLQGPRYHAAAALLANGAVALAADAGRILQALHVPRAERERALAGLLRSVAQNIERVGLPDALTGPIVRGDASAVAFHMSALDETERAVYVDVSKRILALAIEAGVPTVPARAIAGVLERKAPKPRSKRR